MTTRHTLECLPRELRKGFRAYRRRMRLLRSVSAIVAAVVLYALLVWVAIHVDRFTGMDAAARQTMLFAVHAAAVAFALFGLGRALLRRIPLTEIASCIERADVAGTQERYSALIDVASRDETDLNATERHLADVLCTTTLALPNHLTAARHARAPHIRHWACAGILPAVLFALPALLWDYQLDTMLSRFYHPHRAIARPSFVRLAAITEKTAVGRGEVFLLQARKQGTVPGPWRWFMQAVGHPFTAAPIIDIAGKPDAAATASSGLSLLDEGLYFHSIADVQRPFRFRLRADDFVGEWIPITVYDLPEVIDLRVEITPPPYAGVAKQTLHPRQGQELYCLKGSVIRVIFRANQPVATREILSAVIAKPIIPFWEEDGNTGFYRFIFRDKDTLRIRLVNSDGHENSEPAIVRFEMMMDKAPVVDLDSSAVPALLSSTDKVEMPIKLRDDYGVRQVSFSYLRNPIPGRDAKFEEMAIDLADGKDGKALELQPLFDLKKTNAVPGDVLQVRVLARDALGQIGVSHDIHLNVRAFGRETAEERSIRNMRALLAALVTALESSHTAGKGPVPLGITTAVYERIRSNLKEQGIAVAEEASLQSLFAAVAEEHYYTGHPRDRENMRLFHTALAAVPLVAAWGDDPVFERNDAMITLCENAFLPILDDRDLRNLLWRIVGVQEAISRRQTHDKAPPAQQLAGALESALLDINTRVAGIAARTGWLSTEVAQGISREIRDALAPTGTSAAPVAAPRGAEPADAFAAYDPAAATAVPETGTGGRNRPRPAADLQAVHAALGKLRDECRAALERSTRTWLTAEARLRTFHADTMRRCAEKIAENEPDTVRIGDVLLPLLEDEARMLALAPYAPVAAVVDNCRFFAEGLRAVYAPDTRTETPLSACDSPAMRQDARDNAALFARTALLELAADVNASETETLGQTLILRNLARMTGTGDGKQEAEVQIPDTVPVPSEAATDHEAALAQDVEAVLPPLDFNTTGRELQARFDDTNGSERDKRGRRLPVSTEERKRFLVREKLYLSAALYRFRLQLLLAAFSDNEDIPRHARIFFSLRDFYNRPRIDPVAPAGHGQLMPEDYDNQLYIDKIPGHREAVLVRLANIFAEDANERYDADNEYLRKLNEEYGRVHRQSLMYRELLGADAAERTERIGEHIATSEELGKAFARQVRRRVEVLLADARQAQKDAAVSTLPTALLTGIAALQSDIMRLGDDRYRESLLAACGKLATQTRGIEEKDVTVSMAHYHLDALAAGLREIGQTLTYYQTTVDHLQYLGGLPETSTDGTFRHYESGRTFREHAALHRRRSLDCVLAAQRDGVAPLQAGSFHASHGHRGILSERTAFRYQKPVTGNVGKERYDRHMVAVWTQSRANPLRFYGDLYNEFTARRQAVRHGWGVPREYRK